MVVTNTYTTAVPNHRQNRRRERPGSRIRKSRKSHIQSCNQEDFQEGILDARDSDLCLPSDRSRPSPMLRLNFDQSWQRWKARQAEEEQIAEMDRMQLEQEQIKLFGGDFGDDELYRMGILYHDENVQEEPNSVACDIPSTPMFFLRPSKSSRRTRRSKLRDLPLYLSMSDLSHDADIARLLSSSISHTQTIQHRDVSPSPLMTDIPQSLPPASALEFTHGSTRFLDDTISNSTLAFDFPISGDWTFIGTAPHTPLVSTPSSEPETWILLSDDS